jgi:thiol-disulfide isomerase/thioredoxin
MIRFLTFLETHFIGIVNFKSICRKISSYYNFMKKSKFRIRKSLTNLPILHKIGDMSTLYSILITKAKSFQWDFWSIGLALIAGLMLSILSWFELCVEHCSANQDYRLFGFPFAIVGMIFFTVLVALHIFSKRYQLLSRFVGWLIAAALGSELMFIAVQKYQIGHWCPVCLSIATTVAAAALVLLTGYLLGFKIILQHHNRGETMQKIKQGLKCFTFVIFGFLISFIGISKPDSAEAAINDVKDRMAFGVRNSPVEVYFVTDWYCPSCRKVEPEIERIYPQIESRVTFYFIDYPIHKKSLNFSPYNIAFLINNKPQYFQARQLLADLSEKTETPNNDDIEKAARRNRIAYEELTFLDIKTGLEFFEKIVNQYDLHATPTVIITNPRRNSVVKLEGRDEISGEKILNAIVHMTPSN